MATKKTARTVRKVSRTPKNATSKTLWIVLGVILLIFVALAMTKDASAPATPSSASIPAIQSLAFDFNNQKFMLDGRELSFMNGTYKDTITTDSQHVATMTNRSVNTEGSRAAAILIDNPGGSGTFYYLVGAMVKNGVETYSVPVMIGDRIQVVSVTVDNPQSQDNGMITVNYLERAADAPMSADPTEKRTAKFAFQDDGNLISVLN